MITGIKSCKKRFAGFKAKGGGQTFAMPTFCPVNYNHMLKWPPPANRSPLNLVRFNFPLQPAGRFKASPFEKVAYGPR